MTETQHLYRRRTDQSTTVSALAEKAYNAYHRGSGKGGLTFPAPSTFEELTVYHQNPWRGAVRSILSLDRRTPAWTVSHHINPVEGEEWPGTGLEFFDHEDIAKQCRDRHEVAGKEAVMRPYNEFIDDNHLNHP